MTGTGTDDGSVIYRLAARDKFWLALIGSFVGLFSLVVGVYTAYTQHTISRDDANRDSRISENSTVIQSNTTRLNGLDEDSKTWDRALQDISKIDERTKIMLELLSNQTRPLGDN